MKILNSISKTIDIYIPPLMLLVMGIIFLILSLTTHLPNLNNLLEYHAHLKSYYIKEQCYRYSNCDFTSIITLQEGYRIWTNALNKDTAKTLLTRQGIELRFYIDPNSRAKLIDGAIKTYGLWVNDQQVLTAKNAIDQEKLTVYQGYPALGVFMILAAIFIYFYQTNKKLNTQLNKDH